MTEKNYNPEQKNAKTIKKQNLVATTKTEEKIKAPVKNEKLDDKKAEEKKITPKHHVVKKEFAVVNARSLPISTLESMYICKFIKYKTIERAIEDLKKVIEKKIAVPMKGEVAHRKRSECVMAGRFPIKAAEEFIIILKGLKGNSIVNGLENPVISSAHANIASRPYGRFGAIRRKRTHVELVARNKKENKK